MAVKLKLGGRKIKNQFVLSIGDEGAILSHFHGGKLENRLFVDNANSLDINLMEKLLNTYTKSPLSILVDVIEQNYTQQILPPVSALTVNQQVQRRIKRDFQPQDFNNYIPMGRSTEGRKDWNFLFISLANAEPFSKWLEFAINQKNDFRGVYLLPVEMQDMMSDLSKSKGAKKPKEWEIGIFHNKTGGFRIIALKKGKIIFTRLAQQLIGESVPEIVVGTLEQEVINTIEYLKRLGFRGEADSGITLVAAQELLEKLDKNVWKFGNIDLLTPIQAAQILRLTHAVNDKDKYADTLCATFFAAHKPTLKFDSESTEKISMLYSGMKAVLIGGTLLIGGAILLSAYAGYEIISIQEEASITDTKLNRARIELNDFKKAETLLPADYKKRIDIMQITKALPGAQNQVIEKIFNIGNSIVNYKSSESSEDRYLTRLLKFKVIKDEQSQNPILEDIKFTMEIEFELEMLASEQDFAGDRATAFMAALKKQFESYEFIMAQKPQPVVAGNQKVAIEQEVIDPTQKVRLPGRLTINGRLYENKAG